VTGTGTTASRVPAAGGMRGEAVGGPPGWRSRPGGPEASPLESIGTGSGRSGARSMNGMAGSWDARMNEPTMGC
jgi:hypothetical protein